MRVIFSRAECEHIAYTTNERALRTVEAVSFDIPALRITFTAAALDGADPMMLELSRDQLRALDTLLTDSDPRAGKLPDGTPVLGLVEKIWRALIGKAGEVDASTNHDHADSHADASANDAPLRGP